MDTKSSLKNRSLINKKIQRKVQIPQRPLKRFKMSLFFIFPHFFHDMDQTENLRI